MLVGTLNAMSATPTCEEEPFRLERRERADFRDSCASGLERCGEAQGAGEGEEEGRGWRGSGFRDEGEIGWKRVGLG